jgi:hypothetical protein
MAHAPFGTAWSRHISGDFTSQPNNLSCVARKLPSAAYYHVRSCKPSDLRRLAIYFRAAWYLNTFSFLESNQKIQFQSLHFRKPTIQIMLTSTNLRNGHRHVRNPKMTHAYLVGGGIASLAAAVTLLREAKVPATQIHILESSSIVGGSMDAAGTPKTGYTMRGGRMLNFSYVCLYDLLGQIPSLTDGKKSVLQEIKEFNAVEGNKTHDNARFVKHHKHFGLRETLEIDDGRNFGLSVDDRLKLSKVMLQTEESLGEKKIEDCFNESFFSSNFWYMWATM